MQLFVDMDGVLADFDRHHETVFGERASKEADNVDWSRVNEYPGFHLNIPPMADMLELWHFISPYKPIVLTGVPVSVDKAVNNKRKWVAKHLGKHVEVRCCLSKEKCLHAQHGDVLVDDWTKYQHLWVQAGGIWVTHTSAKSTIEKLKPLLEK